MKRSLTFVLVICSALIVRAQVNDWENPSVLSINKLPYHATLQLPSKWKECKEIVSLDGQWQFHWSKDPDSRPADFYREDYDVSHWDKITVPGNWQLQGYGKPIYVNMHYPFHRDRPSVTDRTAQGLDCLREPQPRGIVCDVRRCHQGDALEESHFAFRRCAFGNVSLDQRPEGGL